MIKKLFLLTIIFFGIFQICNVFAEDSDLDVSKKSYQQASENYNNAKHNYEAVLIEESNTKEVYWEDSPEYRESQAIINNAKIDVENTKKLMNYEKQKFNEERNEECKNSWDCIDKDTFMFNPADNFWIWPSFGWKSTSQWVNNVFGTVIQKLMVALWALSVLIMTVGWWYIILYHGQDELLSKGKSIFMSGVIALIVALSSYMIVGLLRFILYNT